MAFAARGKCLSALALLFAVCLRTASAFPPVPPPAPPPPPHRPPAPPGLVEADAGGPYELDCYNKISFDASLSAVPVDSPVTYTWILQDPVTGSETLLSSSENPVFQVSLDSLGLMGSPAQSLTLILYVENESSNYTSNATTVVTTPGPCVVVENDPHFVGAHGTHFDFNGVLGESYCLITDAGINVNAKLKGYTSEGTVGSTINAAGQGTRSWMGELAFVWSEGGTRGVRHTLHLVSRSGKGSRRGPRSFVATARFDGKELPIPSVRGTVLNAGDATLTFKGTKSKRSFDVDQFHFVIKNKADLMIEVLPATPKFQQPGDSQVHFNLHISKLMTTARVHGVLGQTFRRTASQQLKAAKYQALSRLLGEPIKADGASGYGFLDGTVEDYVVSHVLQPDCKKAAFA